MNNLKILFEHLMPFLDGRKIDSICDFLHDTIIVDAYLSLLARRNHYSEEIINHNIRSRNMNNIDELEENIIEILQCFNNSIDNMIKKDNVSEDDSKILFLSNLQTVEAILVKEDKEFIVALLIHLFEFDYCGDSAILAAIYDITKDCVDQNMFMTKILLQLFLIARIKDFSTLANDLPLIKSIINDLNCEYLRVECKLSLEFMYQESNKKKIILEHLKNDVPYFDESCGFSIYSELLAFKDSYSLLNHYDKNTRDELLRSLMLVLCWRK